MGAMAVRQLLSALPTRRSAATMSLSPRALLCAAVLASAACLSSVAGPAAASGPMTGPVLAAAAGSAPARTSGEENWVSPVSAMEIAAAFDPPAETWLAGHRGIDVRAIPGEPLRAPTAGAVRFRGTVASTATVSIVTESGYVVSFQPATTEAPVGTEFAAGEEIGAVAEGAHCGQECLHLGVWPLDSDRAYVDPAPFFGRDRSVLLPLSRRPAPERPGENSSSAGGAWGGHSNGRIPAAAMCALESAPGQRLRCDAQASFDRLSRAFAARFGAPLSVTDAYRDFDTQVVLKRRKGRLAATPGTSNHGWALAVDLGGGVNSFGSAEHAWMRANAAQFGWVLPQWAQQTGSLPEPWHWEFRK